MRILMVEDEKHLAEALAVILKKHNYSVDLAFDGEYGLDCGLSGIYDLIILDIMLPKRDGLSVLKELRDSGVTTPVLLLTAKGETEDKVRGLDCGADDYLAKPFPTEELLARLRALSRRKGELVPGNILEFGELRFDPQTLNLSSAQGALKLTLKESQLMEILLQRKNTIVSKEYIIEKIWGFDTDAMDGNVEVYISFLRKKLNHIQAAVVIKNIRGAGYILRQEDGR